MDMPEYIMVGKYKYVLETESNITTNSRVKMVDFGDAHFNTYYANKVGVICEIITNNQDIVYRISFDDGDYYGKFRREDFELEKTNRYVNEFEPN